MIPYRNVRYDATWLLLDNQQRHHEYPFHLYGKRCWLSERQVIYLPIRCLGLAEAVNMHIGLSCKPKIHVLKAFSIHQ